MGNEAQQAEQTIFLLGAPFLFFGWLRTPESEYPCSFHGAVPIWKEHFYKKNQLSQED